MISFPDSIVRNRNVAYAGEIGRRRRQFCLDYTAYKKKALAEGEKLLREGVAAQGEHIYCQKGCGACCALYVFTTLQEAECITYYLYQHETELRYFLAAYRDWRRRLGAFESKLPLLDRLIAGNLSGSLSGEEQKQFDSGLDEFAGRKATCPFLVDNCCSIYQVRPFACAAVVAVTPPELCVPDALGHNRADYRKIEVKLNQEMPYFIKTQNPILFGCLPELVHRLLDQGYSFLGDIEGLEELRPNP